MLVGCLYFPCDRDRGPSPINTLCAAVEESAVIQGHRLRLTTVNLSASQATPKAPRLAW